MQGRQGSGGNGHTPQDRSSTSSFRLSELNGRQPVVPKPPPGLKRVDTPPPTQRIARPNRKDPEEIKPRNWKWWVGCSCGLLILGIVLFVVIYGAWNLFNAYGVASGSANTTTDFLSNLQNANYDQAYNDLSAALTNNLSKADFIQKAQADDQAYGQVTNYSEVANSAVSGPNTFTYTYSITRSKLAKPYQLHLTLQQTGSNWLITDYGGDLGPASSPSK